MGYIWCWSLTRLQILQCIAHTTHPRYMASCSVRHKMQQWLAGMGVVVIALPRSGMVSPSYDAETPTGLWQSANANANALKHEIVCIFVNKFVTICYNTS